MAESFESLREAAGEDADIGIDFHGAISPQTAKLLIHAWEPYQPMFIEEPVQCQNVDVMADIARSTHLPIATGGFLYLATVIDLYSRRVVGWSIQSRQTTDVVLQALHMAVWRRKPKQRVLIHSDQGSQFTSIDWAAFIRAHNLEHSMSRRGNCHDNAVAESFFSSLKRERIRRRTYKTREEARQDVFDYIEMFYNPVRKQVRNGMLSPVDFERQQIVHALGRCNGNRQQTASALGIGVRTLGLKLKKWKEQNLVAPSI